MSIEKNKKKQRKFYFYARYLDDGEKILDVAHRHILTLKIKTSKVVFFGIVVPIIFYLFFPQTLLLVLLWIGIGLFGIFYHFIDWYFDCWLLTNYGVVDLDREGLFSMTSTRVEYHMIEGISYSIKGFLNTVLNVGDITIDKLGAKTSVVLLDATHPQALERKIMDFQERYVAERSVRDHQALKDMLADMIAYHIQNNKIDLPDKD
ncbi:hypothetical protein HZA40_00360 [Candidatus Peregrinibacteria bacterium]|nr:hypothetical protein [Candidatus Peregrinibacteria bacterium]